MGLGLGTCCSAVIGDQTFQGSSSVRATVVAEMAGGDARERDDEGTGRLRQSALEIAEGGEADREAQHALRC
jgi:hypothetical protein